MLDFTFDYKTITQKGNNKITKTNMLTTHGCLCHENIKFISGIYKHLTRLRIEV